MGARRARHCWMDSAGTSWIASALRSPLSLECSGDQRASIRKNTKVRWADLEDAHEEAQSQALSDVC
eukprot:6771513-Alexandrium_andersonii.AAC.1